MTADPSPIEIGFDRVRVEIAPADGGRLAQISVDDRPLLIGRDDVPLSGSALSWGCYPMVPWAGRIRDGRCRVGGRIVDLPRTLGQHAIHGVGYTSSWSVSASGDDWAELALDLPDDVRWPFGGQTHQRISIDHDGLLLALEVTAADRAFPASVGWHPWFRKPVALWFEPEAMFRRDASGIAVDELVPVPPGPWDDCFVNDRPIELTIDGIDLELTSDCTTWVVYDEPAHATCVEPQTGPPDAPNIRPHVLEPGRTLSAWYRIRPRAAGTSC